MNVQGLVLRPAVDTRPPAEPWFPVPVPPFPVPPSQPPLRLVEDLAAVPLAGAPVPSEVRMRVTVDLAPAGAEPTREQELVEQARTWGPWFAQLLVEALDGRRPLESLGRWLDEWVLAEVSRRVRLLRRSRSRTPAPLPLPPATIVSLRTQFTHPRVLEVAAHIRRGRRSSAWGFQLVRVGDRWRCAAMALEPPTEIAIGAAQTATDR